MLCATCTQGTTLVSLAPETGIYRLPTDIIRPCIDAFVALERVFTLVATSGVERGVVLTYDPEMRKARRRPSPAFVDLVLALSRSELYGRGGVSGSSQNNSTISDGANVLAGWRDVCASCHRELENRGEQYAEDVRVSTEDATLIPSQTSTIPEDGCNDQLEGEPAPPPPVEPIIITKVPDLTHNHDTKDPPSISVLPSVISFTSIQVQSTPRRKHTALSTGSCKGAKLLNPLVLGSAEVLAPELSFECGLAGGSMGAVHGPALAALGSWRR
ncbi:hypothetical protein FPV67DRAFT_629610 [Lyophyllum atratum]|nr:hypothetical protein FPV67DRAFT_629610 [Lyophyllum atratum]